MALYLTENQIQACESIIGYTFNDKRLLEKAFESAGATGARRDNRDEAHVGDAVIKLVFYLDGYTRTVPRGNLHRF